MDLDADRQAHLARASSLALDPGEYVDVAPQVLAGMRSVCLDLPEATENQAWAGVQWRIRKRIFAHVLAVDFPDGPVTVATFRSSGPELQALHGAGHPFFRPAWGTGAVGMILDETTSRDGTTCRDEVAELLTESYCVLAPKQLVALVRRSDRYPHE